MIKIGIIGDIGSGKSFVAKQFKYPIFNADLEVNKIYKKNRFCFKKLKKKIPKYITSFPVDKKQLTKAILNNANNIKKISEIVHPLVRASMRKFIKKYKKNKIIIFDIPLLLENKLNEKKYILIFVDAKKKDILKRLKKRPNYNEKIFKKLKKFQLPLEIKKKKSNYIIKNNFKKKSVVNNVKLIKNKIINYERSGS